MSEEAGSRANTDPVEFWRQWYEATFGAWTNLMGDGKGTPANPYDLYQRWLDNLRGAQGQEQSDSGELANTYETWQQWAEATAETWRRGAETWTRMAQLAVPRWAEVAQEFQKQLLDGNINPADPIDLYSKWYNAASGPLSELADDVLRDEAFLDYSRRLFDYYAIFDSVFGRAAEEYFGNLRLPTSSDTDRIASLVVGLDDKLDRTEETLENELEQRLERVESRLDQLDRLESKLDQLLAAQNADGGEQ